MSQTKTKPTRGLSPMMIGLMVSIVAALVVWQIVGARNVDPNAHIVITDETQVGDVAKEAQSLSLDHLKDYDNGVQLSEMDKKDLRRAAVLFDSLTDYRSGDIRTYLGAGKIYQALGNDDTAIKRFRAGLATMPLKTDPVLIDTEIETHYLLSVSLFNQKDYDNALKEASAAVKMFPKSPIYLTQRASINVQKQPPDYKDAKNDLLQALTYDPHFTRAQGILKLIAVAASDSFKKSAEAKLNANDFKGVVNDCNEGLKIATNYPPLLALRGAAYVSLGRRDLAKADLETLRAVDPESKDAVTLQKVLK